MRDLLLPLCRPLLILTEFFKLLAICPSQGKTLLYLIGLKSELWGCGDPCQRRNSSMVEEVYLHPQSSSQFLLPFASASHLIWWTDLFKLSERNVQGARFYVQQEQGWKNSEKKKSATTKLFWTLNCLNKKQNSAAKLRFLITTFSSRHIQQLDIC